MLPDPAGITSQILNEFRFYDPVNPLGLFAQVYLSKYLG